ncbi:MAG: PCMD domain-containing protein [Prevotella sp.]|nr:PCMD domain-containing protein [Prevotella sp.]
MKKIIQWLLATPLIVCYWIILAILLVSCIKDEPKNMECDILEAWVEGDNLTQYFSQTTDMRISDVSSSEQQLTFIVKELKSLPPMPVRFKLTQGATISPANGSVQDFSKGSVAYTVTSEDGQWHRTYDVDFRESTLPSNRYDFEDFELSAIGKYYVWYYVYNDGGRDYVWASGNEGYMIAKPNADASDYPTVPDENGIDGYCIRLTTRSTGSWGKTFRKPIAAGNFFLGAFNSQYALTNTLRTTEMGIPYTKQPVKVTGYYKYAPGEVFTDKDFKELTDRVDEPSIYSVLYLNHDSQGNEVTLHGDDVLSSPYIVRKAQVASLPPTSEWRQFEMTFEGTTPIDAKLLDNRGYNLALVFSSSKTGDTFEGAVGSTLYIDKVEITFMDDSED